VDVILTNPPFGGEEERGIRNNFPEDKQTTETALLFLQLIMRKLKRPGHGSEKGGRAGIVVPNGTLFGDGVCARIKEEMLKEFNLHTIVRLPNGVFAPYTSIPTNLLFFDRSGPTKETWYYEIPMPEGRKQYNKTRPLLFEEFEPCLKWWKNREENEQAWRINFAKKLQDAVDAATPHWKAAEAARDRAKEFVHEQKELAAQIEKPQEREHITSLEVRLKEANTNEREQVDTARTEQAIGDELYWPVFNLDIKNPNTKDDFEHLPPEQLAEDILQKELRIAEIMQEIKQLLGRKP
jgi:type I restriction enzyme M protein